MTYVPPDPLPTVVPHEGPCQPWTDLATVRARCNLTVADVDDPALSFGIELASLIMWAASGRRYGLCRRVVRPCWEGTQRHAYQPHSASVNPASYPPRLSTTVHGQAVYRAPLVGCGCTLPGLVLPGPIAFVEEVIVDGATIPLASLKIKTMGYQARRALLRVDGETWWCCNDLAGDPTTPSTDGGCPAWQVTYIQGRAVPSVAAEVAGMLAEQIARQRCQTAGCDDRMVAGLTRVSRRGVTREYDPNLLKDEGGQVRTGLPQVDQWIEVVNPYRRVRQSKIVRPDDPERRRLWSWVEAA